MALAFASLAVVEGLRGAAETGSDLGGTPHPATGAHAGHAEKHFRVAMLTETDRDLRIDLSDLIVQSRTAMARVLTTAAAVLSRVRSAMT
ncbi:hypothetical protein [Streptomyces sp. RerS4]|uniref:hypothetical protein n=1 Tax=Streptomyces sp. RerS4 TaxID=2942449 RepID=UPI00201C9FDC|nr:hypothetical protein [Streptomyces sp. RerS4]UQX04650.1 hypothetical protein M4D82_32170 [Streptomyces sp. RerS4]